MSLAAPRPLRPSSRAAARGHGANPGLGIALTLLYGLLLTINDVFAKLATETLPVGQFIAVRGVFACLLVFGYLAATRQLTLLRVHNRRMLTLYVFLMVVSTHLFLNALTLMPLGDAWAITFASPIFTTALAALWLRERVGWRRWSAVVAGFVGVLVLLAPSGQGYALAAALLPLIVAALGAVRDIASRHLSATDTSVTILFYTTLSVALSGLLVMPVEAPWSWPTEGTLLYALVSAFFMALAQWVVVEAYRLTELSLLMPFKYLTLIFAALAGYLVWQDVPTWNVALGAVIICGSGLFIFYRERLRQRP